MDLLHSKSVWVVILPTPPPRHFSILRNYHILKIDEETKRERVYIKLSDGIIHSVFIRVLEFLYTGMATIKDKNDSVQEIMGAGMSFILLLLYLI